jgi:hypothetical protein
MLHMYKSGQVLHCLNEAWTREDAHSDGQALYHPEVIAFRLMTLPEHPHLNIQRILVSICRKMSKQEYGARYRLTKQGDPFKLAKIPKPIPGKDGVVINVKACGSNPVDNKMLDYGVSLSLCISPLSL